jgi:transposase-like protein
MDEPPRLFKTQLGLVITLETAAMVTAKKPLKKTSDQIEDQIIAMYAKGMSTRDIEEYMKDIYGIEVSPSMVSKITDKILPIITEWQSRPLEKIYSIVFLDAIHFKVRKENRIINKAAYSVLGINVSGQKDILVSGLLKVKVQVSGWGMKRKMG